MNVTASAVPGPGSPCRYSPSDVRTAVTVHSAVSLDQSAETTRVFSRICGDRPSSAMVASM